MMDVLAYLLTYLLTDSPVAEVVVVAPAVEGRAVLAVIQGRYRGDIGGRPRRPGLGLGLGLTLTLTLTLTLRQSRFPWP